MNCVTSRDNFKPWDVDPEMRTRLKTASWHYAALTGVIDLNELGRGGSLRVEAAEGSWDCKGDYRAWDDEDAVAFLHSATGYDRSICRMWLVYEFDIDVPLQARPFGCLQQGSHAGIADDLAV